MHQRVPLCPVGGRRAHIPEPRDQGGLARVPRGPAARPHRSPKLGGGGFQRAGGRGRIELRCKEPATNGAGSLAFRMQVGEGRHAHVRGPVQHDFSRQSCCGLRNWDFSSSVDTSTGLLVITLEFLQEESKNARRGGA
eukprot:CAMPEP_0168501586 /NCGR_PEP_ID=MMETSP0228-20121227/74880_1 /TAXON_ID=133427 /ORGANISM="Protoceratium reticulatum, Strain CCCM 535 (=CCMP 1889)" /LENGTH=137 /DNA_ID=CAMNT_0008518543 /DNA_START=1 /DNA_END=414 /DNA_ORIENTATION=+